VITWIAKDSSENSGTCFQTVTVLPVFVDIDIKPQSCPNPLNTRSMGVLPIAILGSPDLDVTVIDLTSILLEGVMPIRSDVEDVASPVYERVDTCDCTTKGADGFDDLTLKFDRQEIISALGRVNDGDELVLTLTANLMDRTCLEGFDCVIILQKFKKGGGLQSDAPGSTIPKVFALHQNQPNPFSSTTSMHYTLPEDRMVSLKIYDLTGKAVRTLVDNEQKVGYYTIEWDGRDNRGQKVAAGIYFTRFKARIGRTDNSALSSTLRLGLEESEVEVFTSTKKTILLR
jgi:hypothetical protein